MKIPNQVIKIKKYRVGIVGCGLIASRFEDDRLREHPCTHAGAYNSLPATEIVAAADTDRRRLKDFSDKWGTKNVYTDYRKMFKNENLDILSVCTNTPSHAEITIAAAESGIKCIFCEKPIASNLKDAEDMIKACKSNGVKLLVNHTRRWDSNYQKVRELLASGTLGTLKFTTGYCPSGLLNNGTHMFDILRYFVGDVDEVFGKTAAGDTDPGGYGLLTFKNKVYSFVDAAKREYLIFEIDLHSSDGRIRISDNGKKFELWSAKDSRNYMSIKELFAKEFPRPKVQKNSIVYAIEHLIDCMENDARPICSGEDGKAALEIALAIHESNKSGSEVRLPLKNKTLTVKTSK